MSLCIPSIALWLAAVQVCAQTASTGALTGVVTDPNEAVIPEVQLTVTSKATGETRKLSSNPDGTYRVALLPPGFYRVEARKSGFQLTSVPDVRITVAETAKLNIQLAVGPLEQHVTVEATPEMLQTESSALGRVTNEQVVVNVPLSTRNYTQILGLSPGVTQSVTDASSLGRLSAMFSPRSITWVFRIARCGPGMDFPMSRTTSSSAHGSPSTWAFVTSGLAGLQRMGTG